MKISYSWLKQYIDTELSPERIAEILTAIGLEVEALEKIESVKGGLRGVVIGEVLTCEKHPNADKLSVTTVDVGSENPLSIVCGAPNVARGQKVLVATVGTTLYMGDESLTIKKAKLRGVPSEGMICAEDELGLGDSHDGIMVLPDDTPVGLPAREYFDITDDYLFEIGLTPNRIDAASHYGVARDLAAYLQFHGPKATAILPSVDDFKIDSSKRVIPVEVVSREACTRYSALTITGVRVAPSPDWLQSSLKAIGLTPINNVVDVTNFVLYEIGQPLHAFDADAIKGNRVVVKTLKEGTPFVTLDGVERKLSENDLMICNQSEPMCIAGVFGGIESGVTESTTTVFLESACFNPVYVRKTARRHGLSTDASFRFERGTDPNITLWALKRAAMLIKELAGGEIASEIIDCYPEPVAPYRVELDVKRVNELIGIEIPEMDIRSILNALEISVVGNSNGKLLLDVPTYRVDVLREADIVEEILRIYGFDKVTLPDKVSSTLSYSVKPDSFKMQNLVSDYLSSNRFNEIMCNSLTKGGYYEGLSTVPAEHSVRILNPLSSDLNVLRQTLLFGGLESIQRNISHRNSDLRFFEFGNCYFYNGKPVAQDVPLNGYSESFKLGLWLTGLWNGEHWMEKPVKASFFHLKGFVQAIMKRFGYDAGMLDTSEAPSDIYAYGITYRVKGKELVNFGKVADSLTGVFDIKEDVFFAELNWSMLLKQLSDSHIRFEPMSKFPSVRRDLALLLDRTVNYDEIRKLAFRTERKLLKQVNLFDVYEGKNIPEGKKSYAVSFILQDESKTLTDKQIDKVMNRLVNQFTCELGAQLR